MEQITMEWTFTKNKDKFEKEERNLPHQSGKE